VPDPRFSVEAFFIFLASLMVISLMSFLVLNYYPGSREELADKHEIVPSEEAPNNMWISDHRGEFMILMFIQTYVCFFSNGALPSIQTYSCLPYGNTVYHLSVTMHAMANPVMAFLAFFMPCSKTRSILALTAVGSIFVAFLLATALYSPDMFLGQDVGGTLTVIRNANTKQLCNNNNLLIAGVVLDPLRRAVRLRQGLGGWNLQTKVQFCLILVWRSHSNRISIWSLAHVPSG
jgi:hypothetical protein